MVMDGMFWLVGVVQGARARACFPAYQEIATLKHAIDVSNPLPAPRGAMRAGREPESAFLITDFGRTGKYESGLNQRVTHQAKLQKL